MKLAISGHRDRIAKEEDILNIFSKYPDAVIMHGNAKGFDLQVHNIASKLGKQIISILPNYEHLGKNAPLIRNRQIIKDADILVALYDGRKYGGTYHTLNMAKKLNKPTIIFQPIKSS